jgi:uncharacterized protein YukE
MDIHVDIQFLERQKDHLKKSSFQLEQILKEIKKNHASAAEELEGKQFDIATNEINKTAKSVQKSIVTMRYLMADLDKLITILNKYSKCKYEG